MRGSTLQMSAQRCKFQGGCSALHPLLPKLRSALHAAIGAAQRCMLRQPVCLLSTASTARTHAEECAGRVEEVKVQHGYERHPQVRVAKRAKGPGQRGLACIGHGHHVFEKVEAVHPTCDPMQEGRARSGETGGAAVMHQE